MITCPSCGTPRKDQSAFCVGCGRYLGRQAPDVPVPTEPPLARSPEPATASSALAQTVACVERVQAMAESSNRGDLSDQLAATRERIEKQQVAVTVVGEFKRGKSSLVNALLQEGICPVDADIVTAVPTLVRFGDRPGLTAYAEPERGGEPLAEELPVDALADLVSEQRAGRGRHYRSVEVRLPHRMLRSGLCLVDTPGVGGLDSAHGLITLGALDTAQSLIFVTDAAQELTGPELDFLRQAMDRTPLGVCVLTKTDLYPQWRRIAELDREHLRAASLDLAVLPVSSFLRLRARQDPALNEESGFRPLVEWLASAVLRGAAEAAAATAARDVRFVVGQVGRSVEAERAVLERPQQAEQLVAGLAAAARRSAGLAASSASWQQLLTDRIQDLVADIEHDLQERFRGVLRDVDSVIDNGDPRDTWNDLEVWLRRQVVAAAVQNFDNLGSRAEDLAAEVAGQFDLEADAPLGISVAAPAEVLEAVGLGSAGALNQSGGRVASTLMVFRTASFLPMMMMSSVPGVAGAATAAGAVGVTAAVLLPVVAPIALALGAGIGLKIIRDERQRQLTYRRQQARAAARKYVEEIAFIVNKDSRDALRRTQRQLRDVFTARATAIHRSTEVALGAAERARSLAPTERAARVEELQARSNDLRELRAEASRLVPAGAA